MTFSLFCSKDLHTLVNVSMQEGGNSNAQSKEEAFQFYQYILEIIQKAPKVCVVTDCWIGFIPVFEKERICLKTASLLSKFECLHIS